MSPSGSGRAQCRSKIVLFACAFTGGAGPACADSLDAIYNFNIPAQQLGPALQSVALQSHHQLLIRAALVDGRMSGPLHEALSLREALAHVLDGTPLSFEVTNSRTVLIREAGAGKSAESNDPLPASDGSTAERAAPDADDFRARPVQSGIDRVVVTARKREENVQQIPIAVSALGKDDLLVRGYRSLGALSGALPNVKIGGGSYNGNAGTSYRMRGISGIEIYQDGVPISAAGGALPTLVNLERVEVLRGPQGTLFGRNAVGGAIQMVTRPPDADVGGDFELTFGSNGRQDFVGSFNYPLGDTLSARFSTSLLNRDGFVRSTKVDASFGSQDDITRSLDLLWRPGEAFSGRLQFGTSRRSSNGTPHVNLQFNAVCPDDPLPSQYLARDGAEIHAAPNAICILQSAPIDYSVISGTNALEFQPYGALREYRNTVDDPTLSRWWQKTSDVKLDLRLQLDDHWSMRSISSYRWGSSVNPSSLDGTGLELAYRTNELEIENRFLTSELQLQFEGRRWQGTTGLYHERSPGALDRRVPWLHTELLRPGIREAAESWLGMPIDSLHLTSRPVFLGNYLGIINQTESAQSAIFTEWTYRMSSRLSLSGGLRYTNQRVPRTTYRPDQLLNPVPACCHLDPDVDYLATSGEPSIWTTRFTQWTPRLSMQYEWSESIMGYGTYSKGAIAGGMNTPLRVAGVDAYAFHPQVVRNYEVGVKAEVAGGRLRLNGALFYDDYENIHVSEEIYPGIGVTNNAQGKVTGLELEGVWLPRDNLALNFAIGLLDSEYTDLGNTRLLFPDTPFPLAPAYTLNIGAEYRWELGTDGDLGLRIDYTAEDATVNVVDRLNQGEIPAYAIMGARLDYQPTWARWAVALSATNLTNAYYWTSVFAPPGDQYVGASLARPREYGLTFSWEFH